MKSISFLFVLTGLILFSGCMTDNTAALAAREELRNSQIPFSQASFIRAIAKGDAELVDLFLKAGIDTALQQSNSKPLIIAVVSNQPKIVEMLLAHGVEVDQEEYNRTPLCVAADKGYTDIATTLIAKGADVDYLQNDLNPLILASANGHLEIVQLLINSDADINIQGESNKYSPLMVAAKYGHSDVIKLLLEKDADAQALDHGGNRALVLAIYNDQIDAAKVLVQDKSFSPEKDSLTALVIAIAKNKMEITQEIINRGGDVNAVYGLLPLLSWAIMNNYTPGAELLIKSGADINKADKMQKLPIDYALTAKNEKIISMLKSKPAVIIESK
jgi:ankyrin repeat protein